MRRVATTTLFAGAFVPALGAEQTAVAISSFFDVLTALTWFGPPYPTAPVSAAVATEEGGLYLDHRQLDLGVGGCTNGPGTLLATRYDTTFEHYSMHGSTQAGVCSFFEVFLELNSTVPSASFFDVVVELRSAGGSLDPLLPTLTIATSALHDVHPIGVEPATWTAVKGLFGR